MSRHVAIPPLRVKLVTVFLIVSLVGGSLAIEIGASQLSGEIGRTDRSAPVRAPVVPGARLLTSLRTL
jgi:hypothetical protein